MDPRKGIPETARLQRSELDGFLAGIALRQSQTAGAGGAEQVFNQDPARLAAQQITLTNLAQRLLPVGALSPTARAAFSRTDERMLLTTAENLATALETLHTIGVTFDVTSAQLLELADKRGLFATFRLLGMQMVNGAMDQRALVGAFLSFLLTDILDAVDRRYHDAQVPARERDELLDDFAPALLLLDEALRYPVERKGELADRRAALRGAKAEAEADAALAETTLKLRQELFVPRAELFAAARRHLEKTNPAALAAAGAGTTASAAPPPGPRRIV